MPESDPPPAALRDLLAFLIEQGIRRDAYDPGAYIDINGPHARLDGDFDLRNVADAILSNPRIAVIQLPEVVPHSLPGEPHELMHAKLPHAADLWPRVERHNGRVRLASVNNPFRTDTEAADTAAAILAILNHTN